MFLAVHATVGALIGVVVPSNSLAFGLGFVSHFLTDMIPHGDEHVYNGYKSGRKIKKAYVYVALDALATFVLIVLLFVKRDYFDPESMAWGVIGGLLPDALVGLAEVTKPERRRHLLARWLAKFHRFHMRNHHAIIKRVRKFERDIPLSYGLIFQVVTLTILLKAVL